MCPDLLNFHHTKLSPIKDDKLKSGEMSTVKAGSDGFRLATHRLMKIFLTSGFAEVYEVLIFFK